MLPPLFLFFGEWRAFRGCGWGRRNVLDFGYFVRTYVDVETGILICWLWLFASIPRLCPWWDGGKAGFSVKGKGRTQTRLSIGFLLTKIDSPAYGPPVPPRSILG